MNSHRGATSDSSENRHKAKFDNLPARSQTVPTKIRTEISVVGPIVEE